MKTSQSPIRLIVPFIVVITLLAVVFATACAAPSTESSYPATPPTPAPPPAPESAPFPLEMSGQSAGKGTFTDEDAGFIDEATDRKIVRTGNIFLIVDDIIETMDTISQMSGEIGGYVVSSNKYKSKDDRLSGVIIIRVPAERFDEALDKLRKLAIDIPRENTSSVDVTEEYTDLEAQLHNLEATEAQYLSLLEKAETVEDILKVQRELSNTRGQIERIKGRMQYLERTSDMSLIEISLQEKKSIEQNGWKASETLLSAARGLLTFLKVLANILIWLAIFCPIWIPVVIVLVIWRRKKARAAREKQQ